jgi:hypothetical protein
MPYIGQTPTKVPLTSADIADGSIALADMAANSVDSDQYVDGSIDAVHLSANSVDSDSYVDGSIDAVHLSANSVDSDSYVDGSIDNAHIADNAVGLAEMAGNTDGVIITFDASGDPVAVGPGSDGEVLTSTGAGSPPAFEVVAGGPTDIKVNACLSSDSANVTGDGTGYNVAGSWTEITDTGADFASGTFTAPETGTYLITGCCYLTGLSSSHSESFFRMNTSNRQYLLWRGKCSDASRGHAGHFAFSYACTADMDASDTAYLHAAIYGSSKVCAMEGNGNVNASHSMQIALLA